MKEYKIGVTEEDYKNLSEVFKYIKGYTESQIDTKSKADCIQKIINEWEVKDIGEKKYNISENHMKDLFFSLAWCPYSSYHFNKVQTILSLNFPDVDFDKDLKEFIEIDLSYAQEGSPK